MAMIPWTNPDAKPENRNPDPKPKSDPKPAPAPLPEVSSAPVKYAETDRDYGASTLKRTEIEERAVARLLVDPERVRDVDTSWIDAKPLRAALRALKAIMANGGVTDNGAALDIAQRLNDAKLLPILNDIETTHALDDAAAFDGYLEELKKGRLPGARAFDELVEADFIMPDVLIDGLVHKGGKILFSAPSKARKTFAMIYLLLCVQCGRDWWGFKTKRSNVLMVDLELFKPAIYNRTKKIAEAAQIWDTSGFFVQSLRGHRLSLERIKSGLIDFCLDHEIGLIGLDPYYRIAAGQDENSNSEIATFLEGIEQIAHETGAAIVLTHHFAKGDAAAKNSIDRMSGAGVFARDPDALLSMTEADASDEEHPIFVVEPTIREFAPVKPFAIRWEYPVWTRDNSIGVTLKGGEAGRPEEKTVADILALLPDNEEIGTKEWQRACFDEGVQRSSFYQLKTRAETQGLIESRKEGKRVFWQRKIDNESKNISGPINPHGCEDLDL